MPVNVHLRMTREQYASYTEAVRDFEYGTPEMTAEIAADLGITRSAVQRWFSSGSQKNNIIPKKAPEMRPCYFRADSGSYALSYRITLAILLTDSFFGTYELGKVKERQEGYETISGAMSQAIDILNDVYTATNLRYLRMAYIDGYWYVFWAYVIARNVSPDLQKAVEAADLAANVGIGEDEPLYEISERGEFTTL